MRDGITGHILGAINFAEATGVVAGLTEEPVLLIVSVFSENTHAIIGSPAQKKIFIGIDSCSFFSGLLERSVIEYIILLGSFEILFLDGTGSHQSSGNSKV